MYFNRLDILQAYYLFGSNYHGGQWTKEYKYTGRALVCGFKPGAIFRYDSLSDNGKEVYSNLVRQYGYRKHLKFQKG